jgi:RNA polymerase sigma factor (TIGR02999 family)
MADGDVTTLLKAWSAGDTDAAAELAVLVRHELRQMASRLLAGESAARDWQATELVSESYLRLLGWRDVKWQNRAHFYATVAGMMRRVLVDLARERRTAKRGAGTETIPIDAIQLAAPAADVDLVALEEALEAYALVNARASQVVELRFFGGFSVEETAEVLGVSVRTIINDWNSAREWLYDRLTGRRSS